MFDGKIGVAYFAELVSERERIEVRNCTRKWEKLVRKFKKG